jgi:hypothetical protein
MIRWNRLVLRLFIAIACTTMLLIFASLTFLTRAAAAVSRAATGQADSPATLTPIILLGNSGPDSNGKEIISSNVTTGTASIYLPLIRQHAPYVCGEITADTTWTAAISPYQVICDVSVKPGVTLTIEAGTTVKFTHIDDDLIISGTLQAIGTEFTPILFQPVSGISAGNWGHIAFMPGSLGVVDHAILEYGGSSQGMLHIVSNDVVVENSVVKYSLDSGIYIHEASPVISATQILTNTGSAGCGIYNDTGSPIIRNNTFSGNYCRFDIYPTLGGGLYNGSGNPDIQNNNFALNQGSHGSGLYNGSGNPNIKDNIVSFNGSNPDYTSWYYGFGGGIFNDSGSPNIQNNTFAYNAAVGTVAKNSGDGGGLYNVSGSPTIENNSFVGNYAGGVGGGLISESGYPTIENNIFDGNSASGFVGKGGGVYIVGNPIIQGNIFTNNGASGAGAYGGGLACEGGNPLIQNNVFYHNHASASDGFGGGIYCMGGSPTIQNNTFSNNMVESMFNSYGGGIAVFSVSNAIIRSNIVVSNTAGLGGGIYNYYGVIPAMDYNDVWNNTGGNYYDVSPGVHDIGVDPLLVDPANGDFHLAPDSPCIDAGDPVNYPPTDFEGDSRPQGLAPDIGADEYRSPP